MNNKNIKKQIIVKDHKIDVLNVNGQEYISLTDLAKYANEEDPSGVIRNWMSNKDSFAFYSLWEELNNPNFNSVESHIIKNAEVGYNRFSMTPKRWKEKFNSIGIIPSSGRYSNGTFAHSDIAFEFASWLSPEFKLYLITEFQRLKKNELNNNNIDWHANRILAQVSYLIHTDAIKNYIIPDLTENQKKFIYSEEADVLNVALFGITAKEWREENPKLAKKGNIRDYADLLHLVILNNLENINAEFIEMNIPQSERLIKLNKSAKRQLELLKNDKKIKGLEIIQNNVNKELLEIDNKYDRK